MKHFFILGCPRSGTTMVQQALNRHSRIVIPPETKYFFSFYRHTHAAQRRHVGRLNEDLGVALAPPARPVRTADEGREFFAELAGRYVERVGKPGATWFGEKTPEHTGHVAAIREVFPDARVLVLVRDGRDVALSLSKAPWMSSNLYVCFLLWLVYQRQLDLLRPSWFDGVRYVRYEDVVADPEGEFAGVLDFLGLPYEEGVARGFGNRAGVPAREAAWKGRALEPVAGDRVGAFRRELAPDQVGALEWLGRRALAAGGYAPAGPTPRPPSPWEACRIVRDLLAFLATVPWEAMARQLIDMAKLQLRALLPGQSRLLVAGG